MRGKLIVIEGSDCSGKYTQAKMLCDDLNNSGIKTVFFSFPVYDSPTGRIIRGPFLGSSLCESYFDEGSSNVDPYVSALYFAADRKYNINDIVECLDDGINVVLDRYTISNMGHQASKINNHDDRIKFFSWVEKLEYEMLSLPRPDICVIMHMPINYVQLLEKNREELDNNEKNISYLSNSMDTYLEISKNYNYKVIECISDDKIRSINDINKELYECVRNEIMR